jgi:hypothetical protein
MLTHFFIFDQISFTAFMYVVALGGLDTYGAFGITSGVESASVTQKDMVLEGVKL